MEIGILSPELPLRAEAESLRARAETKVAEAGQNEREVDRLTRLAAEKRMNAGNYEEQAAALEADAIQYYGEADLFRAEADAAAEVANEAQRQADEYDELAENPPLSGEGQRFVYGEAGQLLGRYNQDGKLAQEYIHLNGVHVAVVANAGLHYIHSDHLGTPRTLSQPSDNYVWQWISDPFGDSAAIEDPDGDGTIINLGFRLAGQHYDIETGLHQNWWRSYLPTEGRYISPDRIGLDGGINPYVYVSANPVQSIDLQGLKEFSFRVKIGGGVGYVIVGGGVFTGEVKDLESGETCNYQIMCFGLGVGLPEANVTSKPKVYDDGEECSECSKFEGLGYIGGASIVAGGGITIGGGVKFPNGPLIPGDHFDTDYGGFRIGVSHNVCRFRFTGK